MGFIQDPQGSAIPTLQFPPLWVANSPSPPLPPCLAGAVHLPLRPSCLAVCLVRSAHPPRCALGGPCPCFLACTTTSPIVGSCQLYTPPLLGWPMWACPYIYLSWLSQARQAHPLRCGPGVPRSLLVLPLFEGLSPPPYPSINFQHSILRMVNSYLYPCSSLESFRDNLIGFHPI